MIHQPSRSTSRVTGGRTGGHTSSVPTTIRARHTRLALAGRRADLLCVAVAPGLELAGHCATVVFSGPDGTPDRLRQVVLDLLGDPHRRATRGARARGPGRPSTAERVADNVPAATRTPRTGAGSDGLAGSR